MLLYTPIDARCRVCWVIVALLFSFAFLLFAVQEAGAETAYPGPVVYGGGSNAPAARNGLPPTMLDSFVYEAREMKELIYGDEGALGPPPYDAYEPVHRINTGIMDVEREDGAHDFRASGLTTGHGSLMPDAVGNDEFLGQEWSVSSGQPLPDSYYAGQVYKNPDSAGSTNDDFPLGTPHLWKDHFNPLKGKTKVPQYDTGNGYK